MNLFTNMILMRPNLQLDKVLIGHTVWPAHNETTRTAITMIHEGMTMMKLMSLWYL